MLSQNKTEELLFELKFYIFCFAFLFMIRPLCMIYRVSIQVILAWVLQKSTTQVKNKDKDFHKSFDFQSYSFNEKA